MLRDFPTHQYISGEMRFQNTYEPPVCQVGPADEDKGLYEART